VTPRLMAIAPFAMLILFALVGLAIKPPVPPAPLLRKPTIMWVEPLDIEPFIAPPKVKCGWRTRTQQTQYCLTQFI